MTSPLDHGDRGPESLARQGTQSPLREQLARGAHAVLPGILDRGTLGELRSRITEVARAYGWMASDAGKPSAGAPREGGDGWWHGYAAIQSLEELHRLGHHPRLLDLAGELFGEPVLAHGRRMVSLTLPGYGTPPHQDYVSVQGSADTLTAWIPLDDRTGDSAALRVLADGEPPRLRQLAWVDGITAQVSVDPSSPSWVQPRVQAGDVVLYHGFAIHELLPNLDDAYRIACEFRFQPLADPVCRASLMPHHHPRIPGWPALTTGWRSPAWAETPGNVTLSTFRLPRRIQDWHAELTIPPSRLLMMAESDVELEPIGHPR